MILYSIGKRIKDFVKVTVFTDFDKKKEKIISGEEFLKNNSSIKEGKVNWNYVDGKIKSECYYKDYMLEGISTHYYQNGNVKAKETYRKNKLDGISLKYNEQGWVICEEKYTYGVLISKVTFDSEGKRIIEKRS